MVYLQNYVSLDNLKTCLSMFESPVVASNDKRFKYYNDKFDYMNGYEFEELLRSFIT